MKAEQEDTQYEVTEAANTHSSIGRMPQIIHPFLEHDRIRYSLQLLPIVFLLGVFLFLPLLGIIIISFSKVSPFGIEFGFHFDSYIQFFTTYHFERFFDTVLAGLLQVVIAFLVGFPIAYYTGIHMRDSDYTLPLLLLFAIPFITNYILRGLAWISFLGRGGVINSVLMSLSIVREPIQWLLYSDFAVHISLIASYIPYLLFPTWLAMNRIDEDVLQASTDLGASPFQTIRYIVLPLSMPGVAIGAVFVFVGVLGENTLTTLLGGPDVAYVATSINVAVSSLNLPLASAISSIVMVVATAILLVWERIFGLRSIGEI